MKFSLQELNNIQLIKNLANKCVTNQKSGYSFDSGASSVNYWKDEPAVKVYEVIFNNDGIGLLAGQKFKYGNGYYFFLNQLGRYSNKLFDNFTRDCLDAINLDLDVKGVILHPVNDLLLEYYIKIGAKKLNSLVANSLAEFVNRKCELFYSKETTLKNQPKEPEAIYEYLGTYVGNSGVGTNGGGYGKNPYFIYQILDLNSTLSQKGNDLKGKKGAMKFHLLIGDKVKGICALDNKEHTGLIQRFFVDGDSKDMSPTYIYILDENSMVVPLYPKTIVKLINRSKGSVDPHSRVNGQYPGLF